MRPLAASPYARRTRSTSLVVVVAFRVIRAGEIQHERVAFVDVVRELAAFPFEDLEGVQRWSWPAADPTGVVEHVLIVCRPTPALLLPAGGGECLNTRSPSSREANLELDEADFAEEQANVGRRRPSAENRRVG